MVLLKHDMNVAKKEMWLTSFRLQRSLRGNDFPTGLVKVAVSSPSTIEDASPLIRQANGKRRRAITIHLQLLRLGLVKSNINLARLLGVPLKVNCSPPDDILVVLILHLEERTKRPGLEGQDGHQALVVVVGVQHHVQIRGRLDREGVLVVVMVSIMVVVSVVAVISVMVMVSVVMVVSVVMATVVIMMMVVVAMVMIAVVVMVRLVLEDKRHSGIASVGDRETSEELGGIGDVRVVILPLCVDAGMEEGLPGDGLGRLVDLDRLEVGGHGGDNELAVAKLKPSGVAFKVLFGVEFRHVGGLMNWSNRRSEMAMQTKIVSSQNRIF